MGARWISSSSSMRTEDSSMNTRTLMVCFAGALARRAAAWHACSMQRGRRCQLQRVGVRKLVYCSIAAAEMACLCTL
jgi:hypothetical protein